VTISLDLVLKIFIKILVQQKAKRGITNYNGTQ